MLFHILVTREKKILRGITRTYNLKVHIDPVVICIVQREENSSHDFVLVEQFASEPLLCNLNSVYAIIDANA